MHQHIRFVDVTEVRVMRRVWVCLRVRVRVRVRVRLRLRVRVSSN